MAEFLYKKVEMSAGDIDELMDIWATSKAVDHELDSDCEEISPFSSHEHMNTTIDEIKHGDAAWKSFTISYAGDLGQDPPSWQLQDYQVWYRDPDIVATNMLDNPDFDGVSENLIMLHMWKWINQVRDGGMNRCQEIFHGGMRYVLLLF